MSTTPPLSSSAAADPLALLTSSFAGASAQPHIDFDLAKALQEALDSHPSAATQQLHTPTASVASSPANFTPSPLLGSSAFPSSTPMYASTSTGTPPPPGFLPSPASLPPCSPRAQVSSGQPSSAPFANSLESAVAFLKAPQTKQRPRKPRTPRQPAKKVEPAPAPPPRESPLPPPSPSVLQSLSTGAHRSVFTLPAPTTRPAPPTRTVSDTVCTLETISTSHSSIPTALPVTPPATTPTFSVALPVEPSAPLVATSEPPSPAHGSWSGEDRRARTSRRRVPEGLIPRPPNAWLLYRSARVKEFAERRKNGGPEMPAQSDLSKIVAEMWRSEPLDIREAYARLALAEAEEHAKRYPDYKFRPVFRRRSTKTSSSTASSAADSSKPKKERAKRPSLQRAITIDSGETLLPSFDLPSPSSPITPLSAPFSSQSFDFLTPPTTAASDAWSVFISTSPTWYTPTSSCMAAASSSTSTSSANSNALQFDLPVCPPPFSAPATFTSFDFLLPSPPLPAAPASFDFPVLPPSPPTSEAASFASTTTYEDIVAALSLPPTPAFPPTVAPMQVDALDFPSTSAFTLDQPAAVAGDAAMSPVDLEALLKELSNSP
ncbi:hypothetical protein JCM8097_001644 [Rhodosporidiobolus ruineniae]